MRLLSNILRAAGGMLIVTGLFPIIGEMSTAAMEAAFRHPYIFTLLISGAVLIAAGSLGRERANDHKTGS